MIKGTKFWNNREMYYSQNNNPTEEQLKKMLHELGAKHNFEYKAATHFETCGPTAAVMGLASRGDIMPMEAPGGYMLQPEEILADYFNDPKNYALFKKIIPDAWYDPTEIPSNRCIALYPQAIKSVFGKNVKFVPSKLSFSTLRENLFAGCAVQLCLITPGHFIVAVAFDDITNMIIYNDPWDGREGVSGFNRKLSMTEYESNVKPLALIYC